MNDLILDKDPNVIGQYWAEVHIDEIFFCACGKSYLEAINKLLEKINWYFHQK